MLTALGPPPHWPPKEATGFGKLIWKLKNADSIPPLFLSTFCSYRIRQKVKAAIQTRKFLFVVQTRRRGSIKCALGSQSTLLLSPATGTHGKKAVVWKASWRAAGQAVALKQFSKQVKADQRPWVVSSDLSWLYCLEGSLRIREEADCSTDETDQAVTPTFNHANLVKSISLLGGRGESLEMLHC